MGTTTVQSTQAQQSPIGAADMVSKADALARLDAAVAEALRAERERQADRVKAIDAYIPDGTLSTDMAAWAGQRLMAATMDIDVGTATMQTHDLCKTVLARYVQCLRDRAHAQAIASKPLSGQFKPEDKERAIASSKDAAAEELTKFATLCAAYSAPLRAQLAAEAEAKAAAERIKAEQAAATQAIVDATLAGIAAALGMSVEQIKAAQAAKLAS